MGIREDLGDRWTGVEETTIGSENRSGRRVGGVVGPPREKDEPCETQAVRSNVALNVFWGQYEGVSNPPRGEDVCSIRSVRA